MKINVVFDYLNSSCSYYGCCYSCLKKKLKINKNKTSTCAQFFPSRKQLQQLPSWSGGPSWATTHSQESSNKNAFRSLSIVNLSLVPGQFTTSFLQAFPRGTKKTIRGRAGRGAAAWDRTPPLLSPPSRPCHVQVRLLALAKWGLSC